MRFGSLAEVETRLATRPVFPQQQTSLRAARFPRGPTHRNACCGDCLRQELEDELRGLRANRTDIFEQLKLRSSAVA